MTLATTSGKGASAMMEKRRWRIPPPSIQDGDSPGPEGLSVLGEIQGELSAVLWKSLRSVLLWAGTESAYRRKLFDPPAADRRQRGDYEHSLPIFIETLGRVGAADRPIVLGSLGRAAGGLNDVAAYEWSCSELREYEPAPGIAEAWVDMARAALTLGRHDEAEEAARLAESVANSRREGQMRFLAEEVMDRIRTERVAAEADQPGTPVESAASDSLARDLIRMLQLVPPTRPTAI